MANIALIHYSAPPVVGGVESVIGHQARLMTEGGHAVCVIAGRGEPFDPRVRFEKVPLVDSRHADILQVKSELDRGKVPDRFQVLVLEIMRDLESALDGSDILIAHNVCSLNKNLPLTAALRQFTKKHKRIQSLLWHHDLAWTTPRYRAELHDGFPWDLLKQAWPGVRQVTVSEARRAELAALQKIAQDQILVVPNGIDAQEFLNLDEQTRKLIRQMDLAGASPILLLPVRITPRKNIELALETLAEIRKAFPEARLVVTGPLGPHNPANQNYFDSLLTLRKKLGLNEAAHFLAELTSEFLPDRVIADFYRMADALFYPSREEGFGIPVLEAGLAGVPVFCADIPPLKDLGGDHAIYFSPDAPPDQVAAKIVGSLKTSRVFGLRSAVRKNYSWERVYAQKIAPLLVI